MKTTDNNKGLSRREALKRIAKIGVAVSVASIFPEKLLGKENMLSGSHNAAYNSFYHNSYAYALIQLEQYEEAIEHYQVAKVLKKAYKEVDLPEPESPFIPIKSLLAILMLKLSNTTGLSISFLLLYVNDTLSNTILEKS